MNDEFRKITCCDRCPCLNVDFEDGSSCNLGYDSEFYWTAKGDLVDGSENCGLMFIKVIDKEILELVSIIARKGRTDGR